jgi:formylglycine-generating enzyme required for sulfatase activity
MTTPGWIAALETADVTVPLGDEVPMLFRRLPIQEQKDGDGNDAGMFWMGSRGYNASEEPRHRVRITRPFYMAVFPVTQHQWRSVAQAADTNLDPSPSKFDGDLRPIESVSWHDAGQWCQALQSSGCLSGLIDRKGDVISGAQICLPTEAQWEYACRAGTETEYHGGDGEVALAEVGWYEGNSSDSTQPVGLLKPNAFGLYDMHGNVWEWCRDAWDEHPYKRRVEGICDPVVNADDDTDRVFRGGSWIDEPWYCRAACRDWGGAVGPYQGPRLPSLSGLRSEPSQPGSGAGERKRGKEGRRSQAAANWRSECRFE